MANNYYDHGAYPAPNSLATSNELRAEFDAVEAGFNKLPTLTANAGKKIVVNASSDALVVEDDNASNVAFTPVGGVSAITVQDAIVELDTEKASGSSLSAHTSNISNPHSVTKAQVGLGNVDNTSDTNKPVSTLQAAADSAVQSAAASDATAKANAAAAASTPIAHASNFANPHSVTKAQVGLGNVDDTSDATKNAAFAALTNKTISASSNTITTAASGNLTATNLNSALAELQTDIDTRATSAALATHTSDTTTAHGVTGAVVGTTNPQTLTFKTISAANNTITTAASGNLVATNLNAALAELQSDIDTRVAKTSSTGSAALPTGTTAQRDGSPTAGYTRFNSDLQGNETWNGSSWVLDLNSGSGIGHFGSFRNKLINGNCLVRQRGTWFLVGSAHVYTADQWLASASGANITMDFSAGSGITINGATGFNYGWISQRIESINCVGLQDRKVTVSFRIYNNSASNKTIGVTLETPTVVDNFNSLNLVEIFSYSASPGWSSVSKTTTNALNSEVSKGLSLRIDVPALAAGEAILILQIQLEEGSIATPFEHRPIQVELAMCQRYYWKQVQSYHVAGNAGSPGQPTSALSVKFPVTMRVAPTLIASESGGINVGTPVRTITADSLTWSGTSLAAGYVYFSGNFTDASAEL